MEELRAASPTVVVIEDEPQIRRFVRTALEAEGCHVVEAGEGERGLVEAGTRKPDLVILDLGLPDRDGVDVVRFRGVSRKRPIMSFAPSTVD